MVEDSRLTFEDLGRNGLVMYQLKDGFRFGTDTVLLSWYTASFIREAKTVRLLETGANCGAATLLVAARRNEALIDAVEIDAEACEVMNKNIEANSLTGRIKLFEGDIRDLPSEVRQKQYDLVFMNPPFFKMGQGPVTEKNKPGKFKGRFESNGDLNCFVSAASSRLVPSSGILTMVMTAQRADEALYLMKQNGLKPFNMICVHPFRDKKAQMVLIASRKTDTDSLLEIMPPLILNEVDALSGKAVMTAELKRIYEEAHTDCFI